VPRLLADTTPLRVSPEFRRLWWGQGLASLGSQLAVVAVGLQVYALTGSTLSVGILGLCALVPLVALGLYGGALVDSHDRRTVALWASTGLWVVSIAIALQAWLGFRSVELLYALVALQSAAFAINNPARSAIVPRLLPPELMPAANALQTIAWSTAFTVGPLLGAVLVAVWGYPVTYTIDVVTFAFALWALRLLPSMPPLVDDGAPPRRAGLGSITEGLRYLATRPNVRMTFLVDLAAMVLSFPRVLFPAVGAVIIGGGEATAGALSSAVALGGVLAGVLSGPLGLVRAQGRAIAWAVTCWGLAVAGFGLTVVWARATQVAAGTAGETASARPVLWAALVVALLMLTLAGAADSVSSVFRQSILQTATPDAMRGRLQGVFIVVVAGGPRLGDVVGGANATWLGEGWAAVVGGLACVVVVAVLVRSQSRFLAYDARDPQP
jgi:MFS family permease